MFLHYILIYLPEHWTWQSCKVIGNSEQKRRSTEANYGVRRCSNANKRHTWRKGEKSKKRRRKSEQRIRNLGHDPNHSPPASVWIFRNAWKCPKRFESPPLLPPSTPLWAFLVFSNWISSKARIKPHHVLDMH